MYDLDSKKWGVSNVLKLVHDCGYKRNEFMVWSELEGIDECYFEVNKDDCALDVARKIGT